jgi:transposase-like protein
LNRPGFRGDSTNMRKDGVHGTTAKISEEFRERAVRLVYEWRDARERTDGGFREVAEQLGVHLETVRNWVNQAEIDGSAAELAVL